MEEKVQEELDLIYVVKGMKNALAHFFNSIKWLINFSIKKFFTLLLFVIITTSILVSLYLVQTPYYNSTMSLSHTRFENDYCREMVSNLNSYVDGISNSNLAEALNIDVEDAKKVISIHYLPLNENVAKRYNDSVNVLLPFKIEVEIYDNSILDSLQTGIWRYLESNQFAMKSKEIEKVALHENKMRVKQEILAIDSLKRIVDQSIIPRSSGNGIILGEPIDPVNVYKRAMEMYDKEININRAEKLLNTFEIRVGFTKNFRKANVNILVYLFFGVVIGYFIGINWLIRRHRKLKSANN